jgi:hypothetical protein
MKELGMKKILLFILFLATGSLMGGQPAPSRQPETLWGSDVNAFFNNGLDDLLRTCIASTMKNKGQSSEQSNAECLAYAESWLDEQ